jgi:hypothetical protein
MRCIPKWYVTWIRSEATLALPDIVYDCHHQVAYVSCIVAYVRRSKLTARERGTPGERIRFVFKIQCLGTHSFLTPFRIVYSSLNFNSNWAAKRTLKASVSKRVKWTYHVSVIWHIFGPPQYKQVRQCTYSWTLRRVRVRCKYNKY